MPPLASPASSEYRVCRPRSAPTVARSRARRAVLIVEDDPALRKTMSDHIRRTGTEVAVAAHFAAARAHLSSRTPDLVCIDIGLPSESGYELCECIRGPLGLPSLPILVTSSFGSPIEMAQAEEAGANSFLVKPFSMDRLVAHIDALIDGVWPRSANIFQLAVMSSAFRAP